MRNYIWLLLAIPFVACGGEEKKEKKPEEKKEIETVAVQPPEINLKDVNYLLGTWVDASGSMPGFHESWIRLNDTLMQVVGYYVNGKDTAIMEAIRVQMIHGNLHYIPKVEGQNNGQEIPYELGEGSTIDSLIFFNQEHDFPQVINYVKKTNDSVLVYLTGIGEDKKPVNYLLQLRRKSQ